ncbi:Capsular polysaccharide synthesis enzyme CpsC, polysaccharide export [Minicystis rosea]|nr:Capsular polysaccharide synthesis enzyme CpsC, polysaccharide export [Minicystis rosea]
MRHASRWNRAAARGAALLLLPLFAVACGGPPRPLSLPPPVEVTSLGIGDTLEIRVVGEDKLPVQYTVAPNGTIDFPYVKRISIAGLEPQEVADLVRQKLIEKQILSDPNVSVNIKEYNSKRVEVMGEVQHPGSFPMASGMTLLRAISIAGGFNPLAKRSEVTVRRRIKGETRAATISVEDIIDNRIPDPPLQAGDSINVPQKVF